MELVYVGTSNKVVGELAVGIKVDVFLRYIVYGEGINSLIAFGLA